jgi:hypothetical protein
MRLAGPIALSAAALMLAACQPQRTTIRGDVLSKAADPSGAVTAILTRDGSGGATVSFVYRVYLRGSPKDDPVEVLRADHADPELTMDWTAKGTLLVHLGCAHTFAFDSHPYVNGAQAYVRLDMPEHCG